MSFEELLENLVCAALMDMGVRKRKPHLGLYTSLRKRMRSRYGGDCFDWEING